MARKCAKNQIYKLIMELHDEEYIFKVLRADCFGIDELKFMLDNNYKLYDRIKIRMCPQNREIVLKCSDYSTDIKDNEMLWRFLLNV